MYDKPEAYMSSELENKRLYEKSGSTSIVDNAAAVSAAICV